MSKNDRLAAGYTLSQYEKAYMQAFIEAAKAADPTWKAGKPIPSGALDGITRESVESTLAKSGSSFVKKSIDVSIYLKFFYIYSQLYSRHVIIILVGNKSWVKEHTNGY